MIHSDSLEIVTMYYWLATLWFGLGSEFLIWKVWINHFALGHGWPKCYSIIEIYWAPSKVSPKLWKWPFGGVQYRDENRKCLDCNFFFFLSSSWAVLGKRLIYWRVCILDHSLQWMWPGSCGTCAVSYGFCWLSATYNPEPQSCT